MPKRLHKELELETNRGAREKERETKWHTDKLADGLTECLSDYLGRQAHRLTNKPTDWCHGCPSGWPPGCQTGRQTDRPICLRIACHLPRGWQWHITYFWGTTTKRLNTKRKLFCVNARAFKTCNQTMLRLVASFISNIQDKNLRYSEHLVNNAIHDFAFGRGAAELQIDALSIAILQANCNFQI